MTDDNLDFKSISDLTLKIVIGVGVLTVFLYCAYTIKFFPTGLELGDSLVFIFVALGFGFMMSIWLGSGFVFSYFTRHLYRYHKVPKPTKQSESESESESGSEPDKNESKVKENGDKISKDENNQKPSDVFVMYIYIAIYVIFWVFIGFERQELGEVFLMALVPLFSGALILFAADLYGWHLKESGISTSDGDLSHKQRKIAIYVMSFLAVGFLPFLASPFLYQLIDDSFSLVGIRHSNTTIVLDDDNYKTLKSLADEYGIILFSCSSQSNRHILRNVNALWHGIGERSLIQLFGTEKGTQINVELKREGVTVARIDNGIVGNASCVTLNTDNLFKPYESTLTGEGILQVEKFIKETNSYLEQKRKKIVSVTIDGHTDRIPVLRKDDSNLALSVRRAKEVSIILSVLYDNISDNMIQVNGHGSSRSITNCDKQLTGKALSDCLSLDRRVDVRFKLKSNKAG